jgi:CTD kinase subunit beta
VRCVLNHLTYTDVILPETLLDLLELYTHYRTNTVVGPEFAVDTFLNVRIKLNEEVEFKHLPRFTEWKEPKKPKPAANGNGRLSNGSRPSPKDVSPKEVVTPVQPPTPTSTAPSAAAPANGTPRAGRIGERGRDGTVRFMLNPDREQEEKNIVAEYSRPAEDETEQEQQGIEQEPQRNHYEQRRSEHEPPRNHHEQRRNEHEPQRNHHEQQRRR